jgi:hypothetical protein
MRLYYPTRPLHSLFLGFCLSLMLWSCGKSVQHERYIPKNASFVLSIDLKQLSSKAPEQWAALFDKPAKELFVALGGKADLLLGAQMQTAGIDTKMPVYFFSAPEEGVQRKDEYLAMTWIINDEAAFEQYIQQIHNGKTVRSQDGVRYLMLGENTILTWANQFAILCQFANPIEQAKLLRHVLRMRDLPEKESLSAQNVSFQNLRSKPADASVWVHLGRLNRDVNRLTPGTLPLSFDLNECYFSASIKLEASQISAETKLTLSPKMERYSKIFDSQVDPQLVLQLPGAGQSLLLASTSLRLEEIYTTVNDLFGNFINKQLQASTGLGLKDFFDTFSGNVAISLRDITLTDYTTESLNLVTGEPEIQISSQIDYQYMIGLSVKNKKNLKTLLQMLSEGATPFIRKIESCYMRDMGDGQVLYIIETPQHLLLTFTPTLKDEVLRKLAPGNVAEGFGQQHWLMAQMDLRPEALSRLPSELGEDLPWLRSFQRKEAPFALQNLEYNLQPAKGNIAEGQMRLKLNKEGLSMVDLLRLFLDMIPTSEAS